MKRLFIVTSVLVFSVMFTGCDYVTDGSMSVYQGCFGHMYDCVDKTPTPQHVTSKKTNVTRKITPTDYYSMARIDADMYGVNETIFVRQIYQESGFNPNAYSPDGDEGIAQFQPATAASIGIDPWNPEQALRGAAYLDGIYYHKYGTYALMLASYNSGEGRVNYCLSAYGDNWFTCLPVGTQSYITSILHD